MPNEYSKPVGNLQWCDLVNVMKETLIFELISGDFRFGMVWDGLEEPVNTVCS